MNKKDISKKLDEVKAELGEKETSKILAQFQQNIHLNNGLPVDQITKLADKHPDLAKDLVEIEKTKMNHVMMVENEMIALEKKEQPHRQDMDKEKMNAIKRGQRFAFYTTLISFATAIFFGLIGDFTAAVVSVIVGGLVVASNFLGIKNKNQK